LKLKFPALTPLKFTKKSTATEVVLSVAPVLNNSKFCVPFCTPPDVPVLKVADDVVTVVPFGIVPVLLANTDLKALAPVPLPNPFVQLAISVKVYVLPG
jgi:hypothetical protein